jgi:hypothetical protein
MNNAKGTQVGACITRKLVMKEERVPEWKKIA